MMLSSYRRASRLSFRCDLWSPLEPAGHTCHAVSECKERIRWSDAT